MNRTQPKIDDYHQKTRILSSSNTSEINKRMTPISSGSDDAEKHCGVWVSPVYSKGMKKSSEGVSGYRSRLNGILFGADTLLDDNYFIGISYGRVFNKLSYNNLKTGDKTKNHSNIFSLYGSYYDKQTPWYTESIISYSNTRVGNYSKRQVFDGMEPAVGKYKSRGYSAQVLEGYNFSLANNITLGPIGGLRYSYFRDKGYQENGTSFQNLLISKVRYEKLEGIIGVRASTHKQYKKWLFTPELHAYLDYDLKGKTGRVDTRLQGITAPLPIKQYKPDRALYNLGCGISAKKGPLEFGIGLDTYFAKKYYAYQGTLKLKANL